MERNSKPSHGSLLSDERDDTAFLKHWDSVSHEYGGADYDGGYRSARAAWFAALAAVPGNDKAWKGVVPLSVDGAYVFLDGIGAVRLDYAPVCEVVARPDENA